MPEITLPIKPDGNGNNFSNHPPIKSPNGNSPAMLELMADLMLPIHSAEEETKPNGKWELKRLNGRHREIMRQILEGSSYVSVAANIGMSPQAVMLIANSAIFKEELAKLEVEADWNVIKRAESLSNEALSSLRDIMRYSQSEARRESTSKEILGIAGYSKIEKKVIGVVSGEDVIRELNRRRWEKANSDERSISQSVSDERDSRGEVSSPAEVDITPEA